MEQINRILTHPTYVSALQAIAQCEQERIFCKHDVYHFFSVARIMYIRALEENLKLDKEVIYATGLLHDIGRHVQYLKNIPHAMASASLAREILQAVGGFTQEDQASIIAAIAGHNASDSQDPLTALIQWADHQSRECLYCPAKDKCKWPEEEKNREVVL